MKFYLELTNNIKTFRLQGDKTWREVISRELVKTDFTTSHVFEMILLQKMDTSITVGGKKWRVEPDHSTLGETDTLYYKVYVDRSIFPIIPSKEQLISVIKQGDDRYTNSLILNTYGFYELREFRTMNISYEDPTIVLRNETFQAGNEYVGRVASEHSRFIDSLYIDSLYYWSINMESGKTNMYSDYNVSENLEDIIEKIKSLEKEFSKSKKS